MNVSKVLILGGGISGLATAWFLHRQGVTVEILEAGLRPGGSIQTVCNQDYLIEQGPNSTLQKPGEVDDALGRLVADLQLSDRLIEASPKAGKRYVMREGRMLALPNSPQSFLTTSVFSIQAKLRLLLEPFIGWVEHEENIADFVRRRLGEEFLTYAIEPFISGVYAGNLKELSVQGAVAKIYALEKKYGSLMIGAMKEGRINKAVGSPRGRLVTFDAGMSVLPETIAKKLPEHALKMGVEAFSLQPDVDGWRVDWQTVDGLKQGSSTAQRVILALPAKAAAALLSAVAPEARKILTGIVYAPIVSAAFGYNQTGVAHPLDGFGFLLPRKERIRLLGALFSTSLFPKRAADGKILLTAFMGGAMDQEVLKLSDEALTTQIHQDLSYCLGIDQQPEFVQLTRYPSAIPQYNLGHLRRIAALDEALKPFPGLYTCANWRDGISVGNCIRNGELMAERLVK